jgi:RNA polymerase sigma factor (sigma-70 family)
MVYRVCWRVLQHRQDAEDAFQATFLVLAQRLRTVRKHASLASWLHGVAHRVALKSKGAGATRRLHEEQAAASHTMPPADVSWGEVRAVLDAELVGLPEKWRLPLVLCYLEGRTQDEAAAELGWSKRTLWRRLEEGRTGLGRRLRRRGVAWSAALSAVLLSDAVASATLSPGLLDSAVKAASLFAAGQTAAGGLVSAKATALTEGVLQTMSLSKIKVGETVLLVVVAVGFGGDRLLLPTQSASGADEPSQLQAKEPQSPPQKDKPRINVIRVRVHEFERQVLFVRDPSSGKFQPVTREDGIPVLKGHIGYHVQKLKDDKDKKAVREALKGLEESVQNMKDLLGFPDVPVQKKPEEKKPGAEKPARKPGAAAPLDKGAKPPILPDSQERLDKVVDRLGLAGKLAKINAVDMRDLRDLAIRIVKQDVECDIKNLHDAKDEKSMCEALQTLVESAQMLKELLSVHVDPAGKKPQINNDDPRRLNNDDEQPQLLVSFTDSGNGRASMKFMTAAPKELTSADTSSSEFKAKRRWRELPLAHMTGAAIPLATGDLPKEKLPARHRFERIVTREESVPIIQKYIELDLKKLQEATGDEAVLEAFGRLEYSVHLMKELLTFDPSRKREN